MLLSSNISMLIVGEEKYKIYWRNSNSTSSDFACFLDSVKLEE